MRAPPGLAVAFLSLCLGAPASGNEQASLDLPLGGTVTVTVPAAAPPPHVAAQPSSQTKATAAERAAHQPAASRPTAERPSPPLTLR